MPHHDFQKSLDSLSDFLLDENALLHAFKEEDVLAQASQKEDLIEEYGRACQLLREDEATLRALPRPVKETLKSKIKVLEDLSQENRQLIQRVLGAHEFYLKISLRAAREKMSPKVMNYSALGRPQGGPSLPAIAVNQCT